MANMFGMYVKTLRAKTNLSRDGPRGIYLGVMNESGEAIIGTNEGVVKARDFRRKTIYKDRWNK